MKKFITTAVLASALVLSVLGISVSAHTSGTNYGKLPATDEAITIDGKKDQIYEQGLQFDVNVKHTDSCDSGTTGKASVLWDGSANFYVYVEVSDADVEYYTGNPNPWETDSVEAFFDFSNTVARPRDQYRIDVKGVPTFHDGSTTFTEADVGKYGLVGYAASKTTDGYAVEFKINAYKETVKAGDDIGFHIMINDEFTTKDGQNNYHNDKNSLDAATFGYFTLSGDKVANPVEKPEPSTSAATSDMGIAAAVAALALSAGAVVALKKRK
ncbi:MAG: hypothetical protein HFE63_10310 [Clostridiales bacterium]|nr:hypothetical protein [Clostridiales bacterium]